MNNSSSALGNSMLKMMIGFDSSTKEQPLGIEHQTLNSRTQRQQQKTTTKKDAEQESKVGGGTFNQKEPSSIQADKDKMTISVLREVYKFRNINSQQGNKNQIVVTLEAVDAETAVQIKIEEIREKAENQNYNWEIFDIKQELGQGTFGQVFACLDQKTGQKFALKFIGYEMESDQDPEFKSAVREIVIMQTLSKCNLPSILKINDVYPCIKDDNKFLVIVMELCDCNLMELIKVRIEENRSKWTDDELLYILYQLIEGFLIMQKHNITHRDIKPQNILYSTYDKNYKIADLGGAKFLKPNPKVDQSKKKPILKVIQKPAEDEPINTVRGSPAYWAPEIYYFCDLQKDRDGKFFVNKQHLPYDPYMSDVYSVGITFLLMKRLQPRFDREALKIEAENLRRLKEPTFFETILIKLLEFDETKRLSFEELFKILAKQKYTFKQPNEDVFVTCMKSGKEKKNMNPLDLMQLQINLADAYEKLGMLTHSKTHYEQALKYANKQNKDTYRADVLNSLGSINCDLGEFDEAEKNYTDSLALYKKTYGDKHTSVADAFNNIGIVRRKKGDYTGAIKYYEKAYNIKEKVFGENNLGGALILSNIGLAHRKQDNQEEAIKCYKKALQIKKLICGDRSLILCGTYDNLARVYFLKQQYDLAISCFTITSDIYRRYITSNQARLADAQFELGLCYQNCLRFSEAVKVFQEAYNIKRGYLSNLYQTQKETLGLYIKQTIIAQEHLALCMLEDKRYDEALKEYEALKQIYNKGLLKCSVEERIDSLVDVLKNLGAAYMGKQNFQKSIENYQEAFLQLKKRQQEKNINESSRMAKILYNLGLVHRNMQQIEKAKEFYNLAINTIQTSQNQGDQLLLGDIFNNMGVLYGMSEQYEMGRNYFAQALDKYQKQYGQGHNLCKEVETNLIEIEKLIKQQKGN